MRIAIALLLVGCGYPSEVPIVAERRAPVAEAPKPVVTVTLATAKTVEAIDGRIALVDGANKTFVSDGPLDHDPVFASDRSKLAFVRDQAAAPKDEPMISDLYVMDATGKATRVLSGHPPPKPELFEKGLVGIRAPMFSPDGARLFFETDMWTTSGAAHALDLASGKSTMLYDGSTMEVLPNGNLVALHYRIVWNKGMSEGRQEVWTLNDKNGKELKKLPTDPALRKKAL
jgi:hypothetical protein